MKMKTVAESIFNISHSNKKSAAGKRSRPPIIIRIIHIIHIIGVKVPGSLYPTTNFCEAETNLYYNNIRLDSAD